MICNIFAFFVHYFLLNIDYNLNLQISELKVNIEVQELKATNLNLDCVLTDFKQIEIKKDPLFTKEQRILLRDEVVSAQYLGVPYQFSSRDWNDEISVDSSKRNIVINYHLTDLQETCSCKVDEYGEFEYDQKRIDEIKERVILARKYIFELAEKYGLTEIAGLEKIAA